jgi:hypothetical protein
VRAVASCRRMGRSGKLFNEELITVLKAFVDVR